MLGDDQMLPSLRMRIDDEWISARNSNEGRSFRLKLSSRGCLARFHGRGRTKAGPGGGCGEEGGTCIQK